MVLFHLRLFMINPAPKRKRKRKPKYTEVLFINGSEDYDALMVEQKYGIKKAAKMVRNGEALVVNDDDGCDPYEVDAKILTFKGVDPKFIQFITDNFLDYDSCKGTNFYVL